MTTARCCAVVAILFVLGSIARAADEELSNNHTGITATWGKGDGSDKGTAYVEEYLYHDKLISDRKVVYLRDTTAITLTHNERNSVAQHGEKAPGDPSGPFGYFRIIGANGLDGQPNTGDEGLIRYRVDREGDRTMEWREMRNRPLHTEYAGPLTFATLKYPEGDAVLASTGFDKLQRGLLDDNGDEWHVIAVGDDDSGHEKKARAELSASDGRIFTFVVNPKAPAITVRATGSSQFYTTPAKVYLAAKVHAQTTYITPKTPGSITFELRDLYDRPIAYRLNDGDWNETTSATLKLDDTKFKDGPNKLEYRAKGMEKHAKTRTVIKNPAHPSAAEPHGHLLWVNQAGLDKIKARLDRPPYADGWANVQSMDNTLLDTWDRNGLTGYRSPFFSDKSLARVPLPTPQMNNAFIGLIKGFNTKPEGKTKSWGQYAKEQLLASVWTRVDPVDYERNQATGANPSCEVIGAGYYQVQHVFGNVIAYDILAGHYRSTDPAAGLTPVEDYFIRDILATAVMQTNWTFLVNNGTRQPGLWSGARSVGAMMTAMCLSEYSTPYFGTSGYGKTQTRYKHTPHPQFEPTWKEIYATTKAQSQTIPGTDIFPIDYEEKALWQENGHWGGPNLGYFNLMTRSFNILLNLNARYSPESTYPVIEKGFEHAIKGEISTKDNDPPVYAGQPLLANSYFPQLGPMSAAAIKKEGKESTVVRSQGLFGLIWYDDDIAK